MIPKRRIRVNERVNVVQRLENCRRAKESSWQSVEKFLEKVGYVVDVESDVVGQFCKGYGLNHRVVVILLELSLVMVVERISGVKIPRNPKQSGSFETFVPIRYCLKRNPKSEGELTMLQNVGR